MRTLIVDDSEAVRDGLTRLLTAKSFCQLVGAVSDPGEAIERTRTMHPHVILQDFSMPGVDSLALMRDLAACRPQPAVLVLSAFADSKAARDALAAGATGWVLKDAEPEDLFAALLGAAGVRNCAPAVSAAPEPERAVTQLPAPVQADAEVPGSLDARTVWALLRALQSDPGGLTAEGIANRSVLPVSTARRHLQRMTARRPALVATAPGAAAQARYYLTGAGHRELARLERRIPAAPPAPVAG